MHRYSLTVPANATELVEKLWLIAGPQLGKVTVVHPGALWSDRIQVAPKQDDAPIDVYRVAVVTSYHQLLRWRIAIARSIKVASVDFQDHLREAIRKQQEKFFATKASWLTKQQRIR